MPNLPSANPDQFIQGAPVLHVLDVEATATYYRDAWASSGISATKTTQLFGGITPPCIL